MNSHTCYVPFWNEINVSILCSYKIFNFLVCIDTIMENICHVFFGPDSKYSYVSTIKGKENGVCMTSLKMHCIKKIKLLLP